MPPRLLKQGGRWLVIALTTVGGAGLAYYLWKSVPEVRADPKFAVLGEAVLAVIFATTCVPLWLISYALFTRKFLLAVESGAVIMACLAFCGCCWTLTQFPAALWMELLRGPWYPAPKSAGWSLLQTVDEVRVGLSVFGLPFVLSWGAYYFCRTLGRRTWVRPPPLKPDRHAA